MHTKLHAVSEASVHSQWRRRLQSQQNMPKMTRKITQQNAKAPQRKKTATNSMAMRGDKAPASRVPTLVGKTSSHRIGKWVTNIKYLYKMWPNFTKLSMYAHFSSKFILLFSTRKDESYSLVSWAMLKIQPWITGQARKQFCIQGIEKKSTGAWKNNHNLPMQFCPKLKLGSFYLPWISPSIKI